MKMEKSGIMPFPYKPLVVTTVLESLVAIFLESSGDPTSERGRGRVLEHKG